MERIAAVAPAAALPATTNLFVALTGDDLNPGTEAAPFRTLVKAQAAVRELNSVDRSVNIVVNLRAGRHALAEPLLFTSQDGGTRTQHITYRAWPGETVAISGGILVTNWVSGPNGTVTADWKAAQYPDLAPRQLFIQGQRRPRARGQIVRELGCSIDATNGVIQLQFAPAALPSFAHLTDVEFLYLGAWDILRKKLDMVVPSSEAIQLKGPNVLRENHSWNLPAPKMGSRFFFENAAEVMDQPREWCYESATGTLRYRLDRGETAPTLQAIVPVVTQLVIIAGEPAMPVQNLHFEGLQFQHTDWQLPHVGYYGMQAGTYTSLIDGRMARRRIPAAIEARFAQGCSLRNCRIANTGGAGLLWGNGCVGNLTLNNTLEDIGNNGLMVGGADAPDLVPRDNVVVNNQVRACGAEWPGAAGIWVGIAQGTTVANNLIENLPYTGLSVGWNWTHKPSQCSSNLIAFNLVQKVLQEFYDGGGIYTLGLQPGTILQGNIVRQIKHRAYYFDQGSQELLVQGNIASSNAGPVFFNNGGPQRLEWAADFAGAMPARGAGRHGAGLAGNGNSQGWLVPNTAELESEQLTLAAWVYPTDLSTRMVVAGKNGNEESPSYFSLEVHQGVPAAFCGRTKAVASTARLTAKRWHHLAMTCDQQRLSVYLDGTLVATNALAGPRPTGTGLLTLGVQPWFRHYFRGVVDEIAIWSRALTPEEIRDLRQGPFPPTDPALLRAWDFEDLPDLTALVRDATERAGPLRLPLPGP